MSLFKKDKGTEITPSAPGSPYPQRSPGSVFFDDFDSIFDDFRKSFDILMKPYFPAEFPTRDRRMVQYSPLDLIDEGDRFRVQVELPGMTKEDVEVSITGSTLSIRANKEENTEKGENNYLHRERYCSSSRREIRFPEEVSPDKAEGSMKDGVLELLIPKREPRPKDEVHTVELK